MTDMKPSNAAPVTEYFFNGGLNCAESTMKYCIEHGLIDAPKELIRAMTGFGGGMQRGTTCGCVVGAVAALGWVYGRTEVGQSRTASAAAVKKFLTRFEESFGCINCKELLGTYAKEHQLKSSGMYRACTVFVERATQILEEILREDAAAAQADAQE